MKIHEIPILYAKVWSTSKNTTIRSVLFKTVHELLSKEKDPKGIESLWNLLEMFIDNLTVNENKIVYETLLKVSDTPKTIRANFFVKSFTFLKTLQVSKTEYEKYNSDIKYTLFSYAREIIDTLPSAFVASMLLEFIDDDFIKESGYSYTMRANMLVITSYLLSSKDKCEQMKKYEEIFIPIVKHCTTSFKENKNRDHCIKNLETLLDILCEDVQIYFFDKKMILPIEMFSAIKDDLEKIFSETENYLLLTKWTLAYAFIKSLNGLQGNDWNELCLAAASLFDDESKEQVEKLRQTLFEHPSLEVKMHCHYEFLET
ncbi:jg9545 [Pararge aegeria aegeria]|uniref:Jg9545 protein n=1 Tax=Pararge aegeria aegeria TaxID=348720 RepID=A0A8S4RK59_9NEOP|nr:jg9545 [Pararge aegeria aegeria]